MGWARAGSEGTLCILLLVTLALADSGLQGNGSPDSLRRSLRGLEDLEGAASLPDKDQLAVSIDEITGLEVADTDLESPASAQVEGLAQKLEASSVPQRQPVLESTSANASTQGDSSLWAADYARARQADTPVPEPVNATAADHDAAPPPVASSQAAQPPLADLSTPLEGLNNLTSQTLTPLLNDTATGEIVRPVAESEASAADEPRPANGLSGQAAQQGGPPAAVQGQQAAPSPPSPLEGPMHLAMGRAKHRKKHGKAAQALQQPGEAARAAAAGQQEPQDSSMPNVELPRDLPGDVRRSEELVEDDDMDTGEEADDRQEPVNNAVAWAEHEKDYGAKLPPSVVEFEEDAASRAAFEQKQAAAAREMEYETPKRDNVVPGADFSSNATGQSGERVRQIALSMGSAMKSATGTSLSSMAVVVGAVLALLAMSVYYFRYMRATGAASAPDIIEVGNFKGPRYSRTRRQSSDKWEGDWDNDNWDDPGTGRMKETRHKKSARHWDEEF